MPSGVELLSVPQTARYLGVSRRKVYVWVREGRLVPAIVDPESGRSIFSRQHLDAFLVELGRIHAGQVAS